VYRKDKHKRNTHLWRGRKDGSFEITARGEAYRKLVYDDWFTKWDGRIGEAGTVSVPAFCGTYEVRVGIQKREVVLARREGTVVVE
jgi:hypothetical protein